MVPYNREKRWRMFGCDLTPNEIGCYLSHFRLYEKIVEENIDRAVILEDDVDVSADFPSVLRALNDAPDDWEFIRLAGLRPGQWRELFPTELDALKRACGLTPPRTRKPDPKP